MILLLNSVSINFGGKDISGVLQGILRLYKVIVTDNPPVPAWILKSWIRCKVYSTVWMSSIKRRLPRNFKEI